MKPHARVSLPPCTISRICRLDRALCTRYIPRVCDACVCVLLLHTYLTEGVFKVVLQKSTPPQIRHQILDHDQYEE